MIECLKSISEKACDVLRERVAIGRSSIGKSDFQTPAAWQSRIAGIGMLGFLSLSKRMIMARMENDEIRSFFS
jgi:hypothetical protein